MKKIYLISGLTIIFGLLFALKPDWFKFLWGWQLLSLPLMAGMLMVLVQDKNRSYHFLPGLIIGSFLTSFVFVILWQLIEYDYDGHFLLLGALQMVLFLSMVCIFGGLVGIVIRGITLLIKKYDKKKKK
jgi:peptidoglycan/LPS O-acetylase OafA/YrhL